MKNLLGYTAILLLLAFTTPTYLRNAVSGHHYESILKQSFVVHTFQVEETGSDGHTYLITADFNLATQSFGVITAHDVLYPNTELDLTLNSGTGSTSGGDGSYVQVTAALQLTIDGTSTTLTIPINPYYFIY